MLPLIQELTVLALSRPHERERMWLTATDLSVKADCALVLVRLDSGEVGIGEACAYGTPSHIEEWVRRLSPALVGRTVEGAQELLHPNDRSSSFDCAVAGLNCALWDLKGKLREKPVVELLGGNAREPVELYASAGCSYDWHDRPESLIEEVLAIAEQGFMTVKVRLGTEWTWDGVTPDRFLTLMSQLRDAVGDRIAIAVDGNQRLDRDDALTVARGLDDLGFAWFEEPIPQLDIDGYVWLNQEVEIPITGGEQFRTLEQFLPYIERAAFSIVQPDAGWCGITEALAIAEVAARRGIPTYPHSWHNAAMALAHAHLVAALPLPGLVELCMIQGPLRDEILADALTIENGRLVLPPRPGLGIELADDLPVRFPYIESEYYVEVKR